MNGDAVISADGKYRYLLTRSLGSILRWYRPMVFVMLNPSTADASKDDPTIRRCIHFAKREGATHLRVVNLFALRATNPAELKRADDPIGPENYEYLKKEIRSGWKVVGAWGAHPFARIHAADIYNLGHPNWLRLGATKGNDPRHPLFVRGDQPLEPFEWKK